MTKQRILFGGKIEKSATSGGTKVRLPEVMALGLPVISQEWKEGTSLDSPNGFREWVKGLKDVEDIDVECGYVSAHYGETLGESADDAPIYYWITLPLEKGQTTPDVIDFVAYPTPKPMASGVGDIIGLKITLKITGGFNFTEGA